MKFYIYASAWFQLHFSRSLSTHSISSPPKTSLSHSKPPTHMFFGLYVPSLLQVCLIFTHSSCITCFWPNFMGLCWKFGIFQNWWVFLKIFGLGFTKMVLKDHALHHICIITMFHAFRCVFTLLQCCMLVGLGWAEPMMYLYLHVTCSCISCICTFKFLYLLYCVVGTFLIVSLSPFISLSCISCFMATKRKSTPS